jgi:hypothetical protein
VIIRLEQQLIEIINLETVTDFFEFIAPWKAGADLDGYVFRGHSKQSYKLIPNALRPENFNSLIVDDRNIYNFQTVPLSTQIDAEFCLLRAFYKLADMQGLGLPPATSFRQNLAQTLDLFSGRHHLQPSIWPPEDLREAAALAQHYGIPTRLLDWTYDPYVALYFALKKESGCTENMVIWALNKDYISFLLPTVASVGIEFITPHYSINPNINAQKGLFTLCPVNMLSFMDNARNVLNGGNGQLVDRRPLDEFIVSTAKDRGKTYMKKFILPPAEAQKGLAILEKLGYSTSRIFPGYDGVAKQILERKRDDA